jgi:cellulose synthase/poly-beta-1,6-N-acetylglucosamine synthase-like glycosyltransferase
MTVPIFRWVPLALAAPLLWVVVGVVPPAAASAPVTTPGAVLATGAPVLPQYGIDPAPATSDPNRQDPGSIISQTPVTPDSGSLSILAWLGIALLLLVSIVLTLVASTTLAWMLHAWRTPAILRRTRFSTDPAAPRRSFSLLVPGRHEEAVMGQTLETLAGMKHPDFEIIAIVGDDDPSTEAVVRAAAARYPEVIRVVVDDSVPKNKPKALNRALPLCRGDVVGVFDAEDDVDDRLLGLVDARFTETSADIVQGGVQLMNVHSSWWAMRNCLEYYFWFRSRLHFHADARFIPLGGNTVFIRTDLLREADGWDADCLAEDCEIGVRLSTAGAKVAVAYDPEVVTREETPGSMRSLYKQRTRWSQGFLQVLAKGEWRKLPTARQRLLARYTLAMPFLQAFSGIMIPIAVILILFAHVPTTIALLTFLPLVPTLVTLAVEVAGLGDFGRQYGIKIRLIDYLRLILGTLPYQIILSAAAVRAAVREIRGDRSWEKTDHANAHRDGSAQPVVDLTSKQTLPVTS